MKRNIYIFNEGELKRKDNTLYFETDKGKKYLPIENISDIFVFGEITVSKKFLEYATQKEIMIHFFNYYGYYVGTYYPREHLNSGYMILKQAEHYMDMTKRMKIASKFVEGSSDNILNVIKYYQNRGKKLDPIIENILENKNEIKSCNNPGELMGVEGKIRNTYYSGFDNIIENEDFKFEHRTRRPPRNYLNTLISFGNSLMYTTVLGEIYKTHIDPRIGYLHSTNFRRFTLNLDIAEIFKPIIIDRIIFTLLGRKMIDVKDFEKDMGGILLKDKGKKIFIEEFDKRLSTTIRHRQLGRNVSYRRLIRMEVYKLQKHMMEEIQYEPFVSRW
ncbi:type I-B CRISPR-associated endonuclease Cas1b [Anaerosalibacter bizertensis]|uniref:type I-B CRISPR-associated endonuclease Cas1b n=1 Tax=Anaerosalibacter bizertensis TaxID=932217 RepID=UPI001750A11F|nr:type I-B CRISPR-associated endonuclease Cas1b [Anaerosalibacter bizertensis]HHV26187.1 type I-B CRISPR-associated endonuclease Cas1 [Tissierellia bacterium]